jgi:hypothetical protein
MKQSMKSSSPRLAAVHGSSRPVRPCPAAGGSRAPRRRSGRSVRPATRRPERRRPSGAADALPAAPGTPSTRSSKRPTRKRSPLQEFRPLPARTRRPTVAGAHAAGFRVLLTWWVAAVGVRVVVAWACGVVGVTPVSHGVVACAPDVVGSGGGGSRSGCVGLCRRQGDAGVARSRCVCS